MSSQEAALDEVQWFSPEWVQHFGGIHENTVLYYFARSPFCEATSNNSSIETQAMYNPSMMYLLETRETFEAHLRTLQGVEYIVAMGPKDFGGEAPIGQGTWVIRKQNRRKRSGFEDEVTILATYFIVGEHIYMAPSVSNVIQARLLSTIFALKKVIAIASTLPMYTPALGHRYLPPSSKSRASATLAHSTQQSRDITPMPDIQSQTEGAQKDSVIVSSGPAALPPPLSTSVASSEWIYEAWDTFQRYRGEYMDENPLLGEPGSFVFTNSKQHLQAQQEQAAKKAEQAASLKLQTEVKPSETPQQPSRPATPQPTSARTSKADRRQSTAAGAPKPRRRKSRAPTTPGSPLSATTPLPQP